jgi:cytosine/uracil/thiamine/allantoin permease
MKLLEFVALYGLVLMPMGAVIMMDVYILPRLNLQSNFAERFGRTVNPAAAVAWGFTLLACISINLLFGMEIFFLGLPGWFIASLLYVFGSLYVQRVRVERRVDLEAHR